MKAFFCEECTPRLFCQHPNNCRGCGISSQSESSSVQASTEPAALTPTSSMPPAEVQPDVEAHSSPDGDKHEALDNRISDECMEAYNRFNSNIGGDGNIVSFVCGWRAHAKLVTHECALVGTVDGALNSQSGAAEKSGSDSTQQKDLSVLEQLEKWLLAKENRRVEFLTHPRFEESPAIFIFLHHGGPMGHTSSRSYNSSLDCLQDKTIQEVINP